MTERKKEEGQSLDIENINPRIHLTKSLYEIASKSPAATISSVCALFIVIILSVVVPSVLSQYKGSC